MRDKIARLLCSNRTLGQTVAKNTFWLGVSQLASRLLRAIVVIYAARWLGANGYGVFSYALAIAGFLSLFSDIGVNWILVRESARHPDSRSKYIATTFFAKTALLSVALLLLLFAAPFLVKIEGAKLLLPVVALLFFSDGLREFGFALIRSLEQMETEAGINVFTNAATVTISLVALWHYRTPYSLALAYTIASLLGTLLTAGLLRSHLSGLVNNFQRQLVAPMLRAIWPFAAMNLLWSIFMYTDVLMLGWLSTATKVGLYSAAQRPVQLLLVLPMTVAASLLPALSRFAHQADSRFKSLIERGLALVMLMALPLAGGGVVIAHQLITLLYGAEYGPSIQIFRVLSLSFLITFPILVINNAVFAREWQARFLPNMLAGALSNVVLNWILIPHWGGLGAAAATVVSQLLAYGTIYYGMQRRVGFTMLPVIYRMIIATILMMVVIELAGRWGINFYLLMAAGIITYTVTLLALREPLIAKLKSIWSGV